MNKVKVALQCMRYRRNIKGIIGKNNKFRPGVIITSAAEIGNNNYFGDRASVSNAKIGNYCSIAPDAKIGLAEHSINYITTCQAISKNNIGHSLLNNKAIIENDVWIGANAVIKQGVIIKNGAVIGANAVVTHDIPEYAIAVGVPAKVIKYRIPKRSQELIAKTKWWDYPVDKATEIVKNCETIIKS